MAILFILMLTVLIITLAIACGTYTKSIKLKRLYEKEKRTWRSA